MDSWGCDCRAAFVICAYAVVASVVGARLTIEANLGAIADQSYTATIREEFGALAERTEAAALDAERWLAAH